MALWEKVQCSTSRLRTRLKRLRRLPVLKFRTQETSNPKRRRMSQTKRNLMRMGTGWNKNSTPYTTLIGNVENKMMPKLEPKERGRRRRLTNGLACPTTRNLATHPQMQKSMRKETIPCDKSPRQTVFLPRQPCFSIRISSRI